MHRETSPPSRFSSEKNGTPNVEIFPVVIALQYAALGWKVIPCHHPVSPGVCSCSKGEACGSPGKHPILNAWQDLATDNEETIAGWWDRWPKANVGVSLGPGSGIIDVECDDEESEKNLLELFDGNFPVTPTFQAHRGKHRLFKWTPELPFQEKAVHKHYGIEFRAGGGAKGGQSIFPPSIHGKSGEPYTWLVSLDDCDPAEIPESVIAKIVNGFDLKGWETTREEKKEQFPPPKWKDAIEKPVLREGVDERDNTLYSLACHQAILISKAYGVSALDDPEKQNELFAYLWAFARGQCSPPMSQEDCRRWMAGAIEFVRTKAQEKKDETQYNELGLEFRDGEWWPGQWKMETIDSDPPKVRLYAPFLKKKFVEMSTTDFNSPVMVHLAVFGETGRICLDDRPGVWPAIWNGTKGSKEKPSKRGIKGKLISTSVVVPAPKEARRRWVIAEFICNAFIHEPYLCDEDDQTPDIRGRPTLRKDGTIAFKFGFLWSTMNDSADKIRRDELVSFLKDQGVTGEERIAIGGKWHSFKVATKDQIKAIEHIVQTDPRS